MKREALVFDRPDALAATRPASERGIQKDEIRLMVSTLEGHQHSTFHNLAQFLNAGDVLVVNTSATLPASLPAQGSVGEFRLNLSTNYGRGLWLTEPRWSSSQPGPLPLKKGEIFSIGNVVGRMIAPFPNLNRLWFVQFEGCVECAMSKFGQAIRYGYVENA